MTIAAIEYDSDGHVCRIVRKRGPARDILTVLAEGHRLDEEDVNWCKRDGIHYANEVGSWTGRIYLGQLMNGVRHRLWAAEDMTFSRNNSDEMLSADEIRELGYDLDQTSPKPRLSPYTFYEGSTYWCKRCDDNLPDLDHCEHVYWCGTCGCLLDKRDEACEHYCACCEVELHQGDCDACYAPPAVEAV